MSAKVILIVDDDVKIQKLLENRFKNKGFEVVRADDGNEAVHRARSLKPDLIIMDIMMPNLDGTEAARILREDERTAKIPVIFLTALKSEHDQQAEAEHERSVVMGKPFDPAVLMEKVDGLISS